MISRFWTWSGEWPAICGVVLTVGAATIATSLGQPSPTRCPAGREIIGSAVTIDGDTIEVGGMRIRLQGVAAPEDGPNAEPGGPEATAAMRDMVDGMQVQCTLDGTSTHRRCVGTCFVGNLDVGEDLIRAGVARDCPAFSRRRYQDAEIEARLDGNLISEAYKLPPYCERRP